MLPDKEAIETDENIMTDEEQAEILSKTEQSGVEQSGAEQDAEDISEDTYAKAAEDSDETAEDEPDVYMSEEAGNTLIHGNAKVFMSGEARYSDMTSSAWAFLAVGVIFLAAVILNEAGLISIVFLDSTQIMMKITVVIISVVFILIGVNSLCKAKGIKDTIADEKQMTSEITDWFLSTYTPDQIDSAVNASNDMEQATNEERCLARLDIMKQYIQREYNIDEAYLDKICDDLYDMTFPE